MNELQQWIKQELKKTKAYRWYEFQKKKGWSPEYVKADKLLRTSKSIVDLGCGTNPYPLASAAVDKYIKPVHRKFGANRAIDVDEIQRKGIRFVEADFENLPFEDNEFDTAYSHHVVEHLEHPALALKEMMRVARGGVIMCPSIFAEYLFGRVYHKWIVTYRGNLLIFIEKDWEYPWFGEGPQQMEGHTVAGKNCNPFDILLNEGNWYHGIHRYKALTKKLQFYWSGHWKNLETVFVWKGRFQYLIIYKNGHIDFGEKYENNCLQQDDTKNQRDSIL